jgi:hypothetical protein
MKTPPDLENVTTLATAYRSSAGTGPRALSDDTHHHVSTHVTPNRDPSDRSKIASGNAKALFRLAWAEEPRS